MENYTLKQINECLAKVLNNTAKVVAENEPLNYWSEKMQGKTSLKEVVYDLGNAIYIKVAKESDSYGDTEKISNIQFVKSTEKTVTDYENI